MPPPVTGIETTHGEYQLSSAPARVQLDAVHRFLSEESYWARGIPSALVATAIQNSFCLGAYRPGSAGELEEQVGFARLVTDYATFAWLCDVYVQRAHRGRGLSKAMLRAILALDWIRPMRRKVLATHDAHGLYEQLGFAVLEFPDRWMQVVDRNAYRTRGPDEPHV